MSTPVSESPTSAARGSRYVYFFGDGRADGNGDMKDILGGKGAGLAEMTNAGVPVPPGFTISTDVCRLYFDTAGNCRRASKRRSARHWRGSRSVMGKKLGDPADPLLVSRALRRQVLHARHDGHDPEPRAQRSNGGRAGREDRQRALRLGLLPPLHPDVRRRGARHRQSTSSSTHRRAQEEAPRKLDTDLPPTTLRGWSASSRTSCARRPGATSRRSPPSSSHGARTPCSAPG